jgi:hypothetical protein
MPTTKLRPATVLRRRREIGEQIYRLHKELEALAGRCSHEGSVVYSPDPSGNNDSSYDCTACGSSWRSWPEGVGR